MRAGARRPGPHGCRRATVRSSRPTCGRPRSAGTAGPCWRWARLGPSRSRPPRSSSPRGPARSGGPTRGARVEAAGVLRRRPRASWPRIDSSGLARSRRRRGPAGRAAVAALIETGAVVTVVAPDGLLVPIDAPAVHERLAPLAVGRPAGRAARVHGAALTATASCSPTASSRSGTWTAPSAAANGRPTRSRPSIHRPTGLRGAAGVDAALTALAITGGRLQLGHGRAHGIRRRAREGAGGGRSRGQGPPPGRGGRRLLGLPVRDRVRQRIRGRRRRSRLTRRARRHRPDQPPVPRGWLDRLQGRPDGRRVQLREPNVQSTCGCNSSFQAKPDVEGPSRPSPTAAAERHPALGGGLRRTGRGVPARRRGVRPRPPSRPRTSRSSSAGSSGTWPTPARGRSWRAGPTTPAASSRTSATGTGSASTSG